MKHGLLTLLLLAVASVWFAGLEDAAAEALGGGSLQHLLATGFLLAAAGSGFLFPRPCLGGLVVALLWGTLAGLVLPLLAPALAPWTAGPALSSATPAALLALVLLLGFPAFRAGRHLGARAAATGSVSLDLLLLAFFPVLGALQQEGLGPLAFLAAGLLFVVLAFGPWPHDWADRIQGPRPPRPAEALPLLLLGAAAGAALVFLRPYLEQWDGSSGLQDGRRWWTAGACLLAGSLTLGAAAAESRSGRLLAALAAAAAAYGVHAAGDGVRELADPRLFSGRLYESLHAARDGFLGVVPSFLHGLADTLTAPLDVSERLGEGDALYVPWLVLGLVAVALPAFGVALRAAVGARPWRDAPVSVPAQIGLLLLGAGLGWWSSSLGLPRSGAGTWFGAAAQVLALAAALALALAARLPLPLRGGAAVAALAGSLYLGPLQADPPGNLPIFSNFQYAVLERDGLRYERRGPATLARVIDRGAAPRLGRYFIAEGRNFLTPPTRERDDLRVEAAFARALAGPVERVLLVGSPRPDQVRLLRGLGATEIVAACDPVELWEVAPGWDPDPAILPDHVVATPAEAGGGFGLVLVEEAAPWDPHRNLLRSPALALCRGQLAPGGLLALFLDPRRSLPEAVGGAARALQGQEERLSLWLLPRDWRVPRLALTLETAPGERAARLEAAAGEPSLRRALDRLGLPLAGEADLEVLLLGTDQGLEELPRASLQPPLPRLAARLAETEYREVDRIRPQERAAALLADLEESLGAGASLLRFYRLHLEAQVYSVDDTLFTEEWRQIDIGRESLEELAALTRRSAASRFLQRLWDRLAPALAKKREVPWIEEFVRPLYEERGWASPGILLTLAQASLEMLDPGDALEKAEMALEARPGDPEGLRVQRDALVQLGRVEEAVEVMARLLEAERRPSPAPWNEYGLLALDAGREDLALQVARRIVEIWGPGSLDPRLQELWSLHEAPEEGPPPAPGEGGEGPGGGHK